MTIRRVHLHKQEEDILERGVQIRTSTPDSPLENQLWIDPLKREINLFKNGIKVTIGTNGINSAEEIFILTDADIELKSISLTKTPISGSLLLIPDGGIAQRKDIDFRIIDNKIDWSDASLDGFLEEGEVLQINYLFYT